MACNKNCGNRVCEATKFDHEKVMASMKALLERLQELQAKATKGNAEGFVFVECMEDIAKALKGSPKGDELTGFVAMLLIGTLSTQGVFYGLDS